ncbi:MAG: ribosome small subunit-dependent GTPase A [Bacteroidales bacterium]
MEKGLVIKSTGSRYRVLLDNGEITDCTIRGKFRTRDVKTTNPVAVGDIVHVVFNTAGTGEASVITDIIPRRNYIIRRASNLSKQYQIIAANIDQLLLLVTIKLPETPVEFIDRFLVTAEAYRIKAIIVFNKTDIYDRWETERMNELASMYGKIGYECLGVSITTGDNMDKLREIIRDKITLVSGNSGVGKTTMLNQFNPELDLRTDEISDYHKQGKHVTTFPEMHPMPFGGYVIDTPGIRGFGVIDIGREEVYHFFPEIFRVAASCRFHNCLHLEEPGCAVRTAVEAGEISMSRYRSYLNILEDENSKYR